MTKNEKFSRLRGTRLKARASLIKYFLCVFCSSRSIYFPPSMGMQYFTNSPHFWLLATFRSAAVTLHACQLSCDVTNSPVNSAFYTVCVWKWPCLHVNSWKNTLDTCWVSSYFLATHLWLEDQCWKSSVQILFFFFILFECLNALWLVYVVYGIELIPAPATCWVFTRLNTRH